MKYTFLLLFAFLSLLSFSQNLSTDALAGQWTVINVTAIDAKLPPEAVKAMNMLKQCFINSRLGFRPDGKFTIEFQNGPPELLKDLRLLNNKNWRFDDKDQLISIGLPAQNYSHLRMYVKNQSGKILFNLDDTPLLLEVIRHE